MNLNSQYFFMDDKARRVYDRRVLSDRYIDLKRLTVVNYIALALVIYVFFFLTVVFIYLPSFSGAIGILGSFVICLLNIKTIKKDQKEMDDIFWRLL